MSEQLTLDSLLEGKKDEQHPAQFWVDWLVETHGCPRDVVHERVYRLYDEFGRAGFERCKVYTDLCGKFPAGDLTIEDEGLLGVFDRSVNYHLLWDRAWAARKGIPKEKLGNMFRWDYAHNRPIWKG